MGIRATIAYSGPRRLSSIAVEMSIGFDVLIVCTQTESPQYYFTYRVVLEGSEPLVNTAAVTNGMGVTTGVASSVAGSPTAAVRGGMLSSLSQLLRCDPMDVTAELPLITNLLGLRFGAATGQYQRGALVSGLVVSVGICVVIVGVLAPAKLVALNREHLLGGSTAPLPRMPDALRAIHIPSLFFVPAVLLSEAWIPSGMTLLTMEEATAGDRVVGLVVVLSMCAYAGHVCLVTVWRAPVRAYGIKYRSGSRSVGRRMMERWLLPSTAVLPVNPDDCGGMGCGDGELCPAIDVAALRTQEGMLELRSKGPSGERAAVWLALYLRYSDGMRVLWFAGFEFAAGSVVNILDGYVTTLCVVKSALILVVAIVVVALILWLHPYGVLSQQVAGVVVYGLMALAAALVIASGQTSIPLMEDVAGVVFSVASAVVMLQACVDLIVTALEGREALHHTELGLARRREQREEAALLPTLLVEDNPCSESSSEDRDEDEKDNTPETEEVEVDGCRMKPGEELYVQKMATTVLGRTFVEEDLVSLATDEEEDFNELFELEYNTTSKAML